MLIDADDGRRPYSSTSISGVPQPSPSTPAAPSGSTNRGPIPGVAQYGQMALAAKTAYQQALARLNQRRGSLVRDAGFTADINNEHGTVGNMRVDGSNQYGAFQMLNRSQAQRGDAARWEGIDRGLGAGGGLAAQIRSNARFDFGQEDANLSTRLIESLSGLQDEQNSAAYQRDSALYQSELQAALLAAQSRDFSPVGADGGSAPAAAAQVSAPRNYPSATSAAQKAAQAALTAAQRSGYSRQTAALAARSAALNKMYGLG